MGNLFLMKTIFSKFRIHEVTYLFFLLAFLCGMFKRVFYLFFIVVFHEMGHVILARLFHYKIVEVVLYPFGGVTRCDHQLNADNSKDIMIALGGVFFQFILDGFLFLLSFQDKNIVLFYNQVLLVFNLLPIIPLDGSVILLHILERFFSFEFSLKIYEVLSFFSLGLFAFYNYFWQIKNYFICIVLFMEFILYLKQKKYLIKRFYLERYLYDFPYKRISNEVGDDYQVLKKGTRHFFYNGKKYETERQILSKVFDKKGYF